MSELLVENITGADLPSLYTPLDALYAEYRAKRAAIAKIAAYARQEMGEVMSYFITGAIQAHGMGSFSARSLFDEVSAVRALDSDFWSRAMQLTDVLEMMPADKVNQWRTMIAKWECKMNEVQPDGTYKWVDHQLPEFEIENVKTTLNQMMSLRGTYLAERVDGLFRALSGEHVTNAPQGFGLRMIIDCMLDSYGSIDHRRTNYLHDLRCVIGKFMGRDVLNGRGTYVDMCRIADRKLYGEWQDFDGGAFRVRIYKKGTAHMEVHPDMAWRLNMILAQLHPMAIPAEFRTKPKKAAKDFKLEENILSFEVLKSFTDVKISNHPSGTLLSLQSLDGVPAKAAIQVLEYLGGVRNPHGVNSWIFGYNIKPVLDAVIRSGVIPEQKSHQYYHTPDSIADLAVELAGIEDGHACLEPSAGQGALATRMQIADTTCVEISKLHCEILTAKGFARVDCADFLQWSPSVRFNRIVMNPPFSEGRALLHVRHAATCLKDDGRIVAIMPATYRGKDIIDGWSHEWTKVFTGEFDGTGVSVAIVTIQK